MQLLASQSSVPWVPNGVFQLSQKWLCSAHQNVVLLVNVMDWGLTYKYLIKKIVCSTDSNKCIMHQCESCPGSATLKEFPDQELNEHEDDEKLKLLSLGHYRSSNTDNFYKETTKRDYKRIQRDFDWSYWSFNKTFLYRKAKNYQFLIKHKV